jgi:hypothetical protein
MRTLQQNAIMQGNSAERNKIHSAAINNGDRALQPEERVETTGYNSPIAPRKPTDAMFSRKIAHGTLY